MITTRMSNGERDWDCTSCNYINFQYRQNCKSCGLDRSNPSYESSHQDDRGSYYKSNQGRPGDWTCPNCHDLVFASRDKCRHCGTPKNGSYEQRNYDDKYDSPPPKGRPGDWICPNCNDLVFAKLS
eukprot:TRINITY_DN525_c0_g1_i10.p1 TRINITY_DN525_c0_g1~~TRINITY_DN525_c0_g1_i10.p1  ORF type:complete len:126 (+),score=12.56 TRINITY_DN525_c0_g1_i10:104-481(+)